ncbi:hypothetical protein ACSSNL_12545 [Thalassobius sp. S69A]|uniref:hypothetical protein n=1 Tax=unclassified Thalassovita TaxID=2619711 RepID=UPI000C4E2757|nr:hypothetical protein [Paracoccaceae bacterium]
MQLDRSYFKQPTFLSNILAWMRDPTLLPQIRITVVGDEDDEEIFGFVGDDSLTGAGGSDTIWGWRGDDILRGGGGR